MQENTMITNYGKLTFNRQIMREKLPKPVFEQLQATIEEGRKLDRKMADIIAHAMKEWAVANGVSHYCHWFQPLTGGTAEKHDSFLNFSDDQAIETFSGEMLSQGEPDASSFPSGGIRSTFEARGYTAWDPASPAFIVKTKKTSILAIPTIFVSYYGQALDEKTPLLRSMKMISEAAANVCSLFGPKPKWVRTTLGAEQEYFLVDRNFYQKRPDLQLTGRTVLGAPSPKDQQLEDHYFGSIPSRVIDFMADLDTSLHELGVPAKTRHNEVAPAQFEIACIYEYANIAADHNQLLMQVVREKAREHGFEALLHEKPFAGVNGSGKHNNWSMADSEGRNLLEPGHNPRQNVQFLAMVTAVLQGVHQYEQLIRSGVATPGNDHRLGANEAPPAIMSVFLGKQLTTIVEEVISGKIGKGEGENWLNTGLNQVYDIVQHNTDRNRTSPFAFTGNKFEFRAVGAEQSVAIPQTFVNVAIGDALNELYTKIKAKLDSGLSLENAIFPVLQESLKKSSPIRFEGNNYSDEWVQEAAKRGLSNQPKTPYALKIWEDDRNIKLLSKYQILSAEELKARYHVKLEQYAKKVTIEARTQAMLVQTYILPAISDFQTRLAQNISALETCKITSKDSPWQANLLKEVCTLTNEMVQARESLLKHLEEAHHISDLYQHAVYFCEHVTEGMRQVRLRADRLEGLMDRSLRKLPDYTDILYSPR